MQNEETVWREEVCDDEDGDDDENMLKSVAPLLMLISY